MAEFGAVAGLAGLGLTVAVLLLVVVFVGLAVASVWQKPSRQKHVLAVLDRVVNLVAAVRGGTPSSPSKDGSAAAAETAAKPATDKTSDTLTR